MTMPAQDTKMKFVASHLADAVFKPGMRPMFEYRDLGIEEATSGAVVAHVIRHKEGVTEQGFGWHKHHVDFQMYYVLKGWIEFEYEEVGAVRSHAGSCVLQPPGIRHAELGCSDDLELLEIVLPAKFRTEEAEAPTQQAAE